MIAAVPSSKGCATIAGGSIHSTPYFESGIVRRKGDAAAVACTAEQTSCTKPGRVSSADLQPPPTVRSASKTVTFHPACASAIAAARPFGPEPITIASGCGIDLYCVSELLVLALPVRARARGDVPRGLRRRG